MLLGAPAGRQTYIGGVAIASSSTLLSTVAGALGTGGDTPAWRTLVIPAEDRTLVIPYEDRILIIPVA